MSFPIPPAAAAAASSGGSSGLGTLAGVGLDLIGSYFGNRSRKREARRQRKFDLDMWNRQNAYNTPANQMQRLRDAGLNPALMYGQGNTGNANNSVKASIPQIDNPLSSSGLASGIQLSLMDQQKKLLRSQSISNLQNASTSKSSQRRIDSLVGLEASQLEMGINKTKAETRNILQTEKLNLQKTIGTQIDNQIKQESSNSIIKRAAAEANNAVLDGQIKTVEQYLKSLESKLREEGITDKDHILYRMYIQTSKRSQKWFKAAFHAAEAIRDAY